MFQKILYILLVFGETVCQLDKLDLNRCKLSQNGVEYQGNVFRTEAGAICQQWTATTPHKVDPSLNDIDFTDGKKSVAKNHCRNPKGMFSGPWCYTLDPDVSDDLCDIPLCSSSCRITVAGSEYKGKIDRSQTQRKCASWSEKHLRKYLNRTGVQTSDRVLQDNKFPDVSRKDAKKRCRNPTGDPNGIWCLVEGTLNGKEIYEKEYCDVDFCDPISNCSMATDSTIDLGYHSHYIKLQHKVMSFSFSTLLWNLADFKNATIRIAFSVLPLPLSGENLYRFKTGVELVIKNTGIGFLGSKGQMKEWQDVHGLLSGAISKRFDINWWADKYFISVMVPGGKKIDFEYTDTENKNPLLENKEKTWFSYYSIRGDPAIWNISCGEPTRCEEHVTLSPRCITHRKMLPIFENHELVFHVRSSQTVSIEIRNSPGNSYPFFRIDIQGPFDKTVAYYIADEKALTTYLSTKTYKNILSDLSWEEFHLVASEDRIQLQWTRPGKTSEVVSLFTHQHVRNAKWVSICSKAVAHWAFGCSRGDLSTPTTTEPECINSKAALNYVGTHWVSRSGQPCLPWQYPPVEKVVRPYLYRLTEATRSTYWNYCRNPSEDKDGPYCFVADTSPALEVRKEYCDIPKCPGAGAGCRASGIGTEYTGDLKITRSNKTCKLSEYFSEKFADHKTDNITVYCQNPDNNIFGPWCNTTDPTMPVDFCDLPDCTVNDADTIILKTTDEYSRRYYFLSQWLLEKFMFKIKLWDPHAETAVGINMFFGPHIIWFYTLIIGAEHDLKVQLYFVEKSGPSAETHRTLLKERIIPGLIPSGYWHSFWLTAPDNRIELGYEGSDTAIFSWFRPSPRYPLPFNKTRLFSFHTIAGHPIGLNFPYSRCLIQRNMSPEEDEFYPTNLWSASNTHSGVLTISIRTMNMVDDGPVHKSDRPNLAIKFYEDHTHNNGFLLSMDSTHIVLVNSNPFAILANKTLLSGIVHHAFWITLTIKFSEKHIEVSSQIATLINYTFEEPRRFYYFSIVNSHQITQWVANCPPPHLNPPYTAGGWSDWLQTCNKPCGGGIGFRSRQCDNPKPHILGDPCEGPMREDGECNNFECGCLNPLTIEKANNILGNRTYNMSVYENEEMTLECEFAILFSAKSDSPGSRVAWLKDGFKISEPVNLGDLTADNVKLSIESVELHHSGIYMCILYPECVSNETEFHLIKVISVIVNTKSSITIRQNSKLFLSCNSPVLQYFYADLEQTWEQDDFLYIDYVTSDLADANYEYIADIQRYHAGIWRCYINQTKLNLLWTTNEIHVKVAGPPTLLIYMVEYDAPSAIFHGWNLAFVTFFLYLVVIVEIGLVTYVAIWYWRVRKELLQR